MHRLLNILTNLYAKLSMSNSNNTYFKLFASCIPVKGAKRSLICDIQRSSFSYIPNGLFEILNTCETHLIAEVYEIYMHVEKEILDEYFVWLIDKEYGFYTTEPGNFPKLDLKYETPEVINNAIIDITSESNHDFKSIFYQLDSLGCRFIELRSFDTLSFSNMVSLLAPAFNLRFRNIDILLKYCKSKVLKADEIKTLFASFPFLSRIIYHSSPINDEQTPMAGCQVLFIQKIIDSEQCCGAITMKQFAINIETFIESNNANTCLNKKLSIDKTGAIKNCPSMLRSFGNVSNVRLEDVVLLKDFKSLWKIKKDQIDTCKVCEYRHICTDCRAYLNLESLYSKPSKCKYNPYEAKWED